MKTQPVSALRKSMLWLSLLIVSLFGAAMFPQHPASAQLRAGRAGSNVANTTTTLPPGGNFNVYLPMILVGSTSDGPAYTIERTLSDGAQRNTIAFDALALSPATLGPIPSFRPAKWLTFGASNICAITIPPKWAIILTFSHALPSTCYTCSPPPNA